jgi:hypothetical protein
LSSHVISRSINRPGSSRRKLSCFRQIHQALLHWPCPSAVKHDAKGSSNQRNHLQKVHGIIEDGRLPTNLTTLEASMQQKALHKLRIKWIIDRRHAFNKN